ncbi:MAG: hypothetical protein PWR03_1045 [Tenuifilum sp.]|jgi:ribose 5-phosphate isomerase|uniref:Iron-only hydrogenase system regulator n=1 Tax=Tenuifilum thalassicum TaxID=2590900 RepID=A0A7D4BES1_9BACT|nr:MULTISPECIES: hypothetical protein [Tenuifilum]MDI3526862.1 hypothetical protein [Tenuifilum sp.]QKG80178.1 hypothetical protein FHG85_07865 [Tenuifilum thalassicum]
MEDKHIILGVKIHDRVKEAGEVQKTLTKYGCSIKTRLGLHEVSDDYCSSSGLVLLELTGPVEDQNKLHEELLKIPGVITRKMEF